MPDKIPWTVLRSELLHDFLPDFDPGWGPGSSLDAGSGPGSGVDPGLGLSAGKVGLTPAVHVDAAVDADRPTIDPDLGPDLGPDAVMAALDQPWTLLTDAGSAVVFVAADGAHVLKLFKSAAGIIRKYRQWGGRPLGESWWTPYPGDDERSAQFKVERTHRSVAIAWQNLREQTALVHVQLAPPRETWPPLTASIDQEEWDLSRRPFVLQHRAERVDRRIDALMRDGREDEARQVLDTYFAFVRRLWSKGITDSPFDFAQNHGYVDGAQVQIDVGDFCSGDDARNALAHFVVDPPILRHYAMRWLDDAWPPLAAYGRAQVAAVFCPEAARIPDDA